MWRLTECPELAAEVGGREVGGSGERGYVERVAVATIDQVFRTQEVSRRRVLVHRCSEYCRRRDGDVGRGRAEDVE